MQSEISSSTVCRWRCSTRLGGDVELMASALALDPEVDPRPFELPRLASGPESEPGPELAPPPSDSAAHLRRLESPDLSAQPVAARLDQVRFGFDPWGFLRSFPASARLPLRFCPVSPWGLEQGAPVSERDPWSHLECLRVPEVCTRRQIAQNCHAAQLPEAGGRAVDSAND